ncbi:RNA polymerase sigma factor [Actinoplanes sp. NPDC049668]|uniref:RNA polymerase sigma factor n=1 Tax=unclassified Actinoplanes TaxID=2626549 RepID=UPI0033BD5E5E
MSEIATTDRDDPFGALSDDGAPNQGGYVAFGDRAFSQFYADHFDPLTWMAMSLHRVDLHRGRDIVQDAMIDTFRNWRTINDPGAFARQAVRWRGIDHLRKLQGGVWDLAAEYRLQQIPAAPAETAIDTIGITEMIAQLPPRQAQIFALCVDGLSPTEIGDELGLTATTVRSNLRHARERLRALLSERDDE